MTGIEAGQLRQLVVVPVLRNMGMYSLAAEQLVMGTVAVESDMGRFLRQRGGGPACGIGQIEPATAADLLFRYLNRRDDVAIRFCKAFQLVNDTKISWNSVPIYLVKQKLISDLRFSVAMIRLRYWVVPGALPAVGDVKALGRYWKAHYNTERGAGTVMKFVGRYQKYCGGLYRYGDD